MVGYDHDGARSAPAVVGKVLSDNGIDGLLLGRQDVARHGYHVHQAGGDLIHVAGLRIDDDRPYASVCQLGGVDGEAAVVLSEMNVAKHAEEGCRTGSREDPVVPFHLLPIGKVGLDRRHRVVTANAKWGAGNCARKLARVYTAIGRACGSPIDDRIVRRRAGVVEQYFLAGRNEFAIYVSSHVGNCLKRGVPARGSITN